MVEWSGWYLDDAHLLGTPDQLHRAVTLVQHRGAQLGLELNLSKCVLWGPGVTDNNGGAAVPLSIPGDSLL